MFHIQPTATFYRLSVIRVVKIITLKKRKIYVNRYISEISVINAENINLFYYKQVMILK